MNVLVAVASRHSSTRAIAQAIADELSESGIAADLRDVGEVVTVDLYDAVILGSAIYMGNWLPEARRLVERHCEQLQRVPVWLFSSGPLGHDNPQPAGDPARLDALMKLSGARDHQTFAGSLDTRMLGLGERLMVRLVKAPEGDFRDWSTIRSWALEIGDSLLAEAAVAAT